MGLTYSSVVDATVDDVFGWHTRPGAITRLTPPWLPVRVLREAASLRDGRAVLGLPGGLHWAAEHQPDRYDPPDSFGDSLATPVPAWRHIHRFSPAGNGATLVTDVAETPLTTSGHRVIRLVRRPPRHAGERQWRPGGPSPDTLGGTDALIHLAGASIGGRFTPQRKDEIRASRILPTRRLALLAAGAASGPGLRAFVTASATGIYGPDRGEEVLTESGPRGQGFLAGVVAGPGRSTRSPRSRCGTSTAPARWPACCGGPRCCRFLASGPGCCWATRAPGKSPRPASTPGRSGRPRPGTGSACRSWKGRCGTCSAGRDEAAQDRGHRRRG